MKRWKRFFSDAFQNTRKFHKDKRAIALPLFAIMFAAMLAFLGLTYDGGRIYYERARMQVAADAAARGGAFEILRANSAYIVEAGRDDATLNGFQHGQNTINVAINNPPSTAAAGQYQNAGCVEAVINQDFPTTLMRIAAGPTATVAARATACVQQNNGPPCIIALYCGSDRGPGLQFNGNGEVVANDCDVVVNSQAPDSILFNGTGNCAPPGEDLKVTGSGKVSYGTDGGLVQNGANNCIYCPGCPNGQAVPGATCYPDPYCENLADSDPNYPAGCFSGSPPGPFPDPWSPGTTPVPTFSIGNITATSYADPLVFPDCIDPNNPLQPCVDRTDPINPVLQLPPGYYQGTGGGQGIRALGGVVNLQCSQALALNSAGCMFITDQFEVLGADVTGTNVMVYATNVLEGPPNNPGFSINISANSTVNLISPMGGTYRNMILFSSRYGNMDCRVLGDAASSIIGGIYCATGILTYGGNSTFDSTSEVASIVASQIVIEGNPQIGVNYNGAGRVSGFSEVQMVE